MQWSLSYLKIFLIIAEKDFVLLKESAQKGKSYSTQEDQQRNEVRL